MTHLRFIATAAETPGASVMKVAYAQKDTGNVRIQHFMPNAQIYQVILDREKLSIFTEIEEGVYATFWDKLGKGDPPL